ncbi:hypothetical protein FRB91_001566 [Serendipita sp. 411]|nr:hypothetical protein FRC19_008843 [Serendipita sp. 401]KAG8845671.1 hypothetical protein FRB91_001566 [Serendipita sp. 411]
MESPKTQSPRATTTTERPPEYITSHPPYSGARNRHSTQTNVSSEHDSDYSARIIGAPGSQWASPAISNASMDYPNTGPSRRRRSGIAGFVQGPPSSGSRSRVYEAASDVSNDSSARRRASAPNLLKSFYIEGPPRLGPLSNQAGVNPDVLEVTKRIWAHTILYPKRKIPSTLIEPPLILILDDVAMCNYHNCRHIVPLKRHSYLKRAFRTARGKSPLQLETLYDHVRTKHFSPDERGRK